MRVFKSLEIQIVVSICCLAFGNVVSAECGGKLDDVLLTQDLWTIDTARFVEKAGNFGFRWVSVAKIPHGR